MWNFKGYLWNSTQNILPIHWKMWILFTGENLRALRFKSSLVFLKRPPGSTFAQNFPQAITWANVDLSSKGLYVIYQILISSEVIIHLSPQYVFRGYTCNIFTESHKGQWRNLIYHTSESQNDIACNTHMFLNALRPRDAYIRRYSNHYWFI